MITFALNGIASCSTKPLALIWKFGIILHILSMIGLVITLTLMYTINLHFMWTIICAMAWMTSLILFALSIIGFYLGKTYIETKRRPLFKIEKILD